MRVKHHTSPAENGVLLSGQSHCVAPIWEQQKELGPADRAELRNMGPCTYMGKNQVA
jgi:hypothetical protein